MSERWHLYGVRLDGSVLRVGEAERDGAYLMKVDVADWTALKTVFAFVRKPIRTFEEAGFDRGPWDLADVVVYGKPSPTSDGRLAFMGQRYDHERILLVSQMKPTEMAKLDRLMTGYHKYPGVPWDKGPKRPREL